MSLDVVPGMLEPRPASVLGRQLIAFQIRNPRPSRPQPVAAAWTRMTPYRAFIYRGHGSDHEFCFGHYRPLGSICRASTLQKNLCSWISGEQSAVGSISERSASDGASVSPSEGWCRISASSDVSPRPLRNRLARFPYGQTFCGKLPAPSLRPCEIHVQVRPLLKGAEIPATLTSAAGKKSKLRIPRPGRGGLQCRPNCIRQAAAHADRGVWPR